MLDMVATRPLQVNVENFREDGMTDEQVVSAALHNTRQMADNWWWIRDRKALLVFAKDRTYNPVVYKHLPFAYMQDNTTSLTVKKASF